MSIKFGFKLFHSIIEVEGMETLEWNLWDVNNHKVHANTIVENSTKSSRMVHFVLNNNIMLD
jgi:hypothetical protein